MAVYGFCDAKGKHKVYTAEECDETFCKIEEINEKIAEATPILSGTTTPTNDIGEDGNIYLMYSE